MKPLILVVEDDQDLGLCLAEILRHQEYEVVWLPSGSEAMAFINMDRRVDLILSDYLMNDGDGIALLKYVRNRNAYWPPFVLMTGQSRISDNEAKLLGAQEFITKPFDIPELLRLVKRYLVKSEPHHIGGA